MYYNINTNEILDTLPKTLVLQNGVLLNIGDGLDVHSLSDLGYYTVRNDSPEQLENTVEDIQARQIIQDKPYVDIVRTWIPQTILVPDNISARQVRLWLLNNNIALSQVDEAINTISDTLLREKTKVEWEYAPYIERNHPLIESLAQYLGLTSQQIDQGFIDGSQL